MIKELETNEPTISTWNISENPGRQRQIRDGAVQTPVQEEHFFEQGNTKIGNNA